jgi:hypothetical protein
MCHQSCGVNPEEGQREEGRAERNAVQEMLSGGLREERDREDRDVPGLLVELQWWMRLLLASILDDTHNE